MEVQAEIAHELNATMADGGTSVPKCRSRSAQCVRGAASGQHQIQTHVRVVVQLGTLTHHDHRHATKDGDVLVFNSVVEQLIALDVILGCGDCEDILLECKIQGLTPMLGLVCGLVFWTNWVKKRALRPPRSHGSGTFLEDMTALEFYDEFIDLFDAAPTHLAASGVLSQPSSKPLRLRIRRNPKPSP